MSKFIRVQARLVLAVLAVFALTLLYNKIVARRTETFRFTKALIMKAAKDAGVTSEMDENEIMNRSKAIMKATLEEQIPELTPEQAKKSVVLQKTGGAFVTTEDLKAAYESTPVQAGMTAMNIYSCVGVVSSTVIGPFGPLLLVTNLSSCQDGVKSILEAIGIKVTGHKPFLSIGDTILPELKNEWDAFTGNRGEKRGCSERTNPFYCTFKCGLWSNSGHKCSCC